MWLLPWLGDYPCPDRADVPPSQQIKRNFQLEMTDDAAPRDWVWAARIDNTPMLRRPSRRHTGRGHAAEAGTQVARRRYALRDVGRCESDGGVAGVLEEFVIFERLLRLDTTLLFCQRGGLCANASVELKRSHLVSPIFSVYSASHDNRPSGVVTWNLSRPCPLGRLRRFPRDNSKGDRGSRAKSLNKCP